MKRSQFDDIASLYTEKVWKEAPLNEMAPPFEAGGSPGEFSTSNRDDFKAFTQPQYKSATRGIADSPEFEMILKNIIRTVGKAILKEIEGSGGRVPDSRQEMNERAGAAIQRLILAGGKPLFQGSHSKHLGRNVVDALIKAGHLKEVDSARGRHKSGGSAGKAPPSAANISFGDEDLDDPAI